MTLIWYFIFQLHFQARAASACTTETHIADMPPPRQQKEMSFCYSFAGTALVQNFYCRSKVPACRFDASVNDELSVLDATAMSNYGEGGLVNGGSTLRVLTGVQRSKGLAKESCAPFSALFRSVNSLDGKEKVTFKKAILQAYDKVGKGQCPLDQQLGLAKNLKEMGSLVTGIDQILNALSKRNFSIAFKEVLIPKECEAQRVPIKDFKIGQDKVGNFDSVRKNIQQQLKKRIPLATHLCAYPPAKAEMATDHCGLHALVVSGIRQTCCAEKCSFEYQFYDSSEAFSNSEKSKEGWVAEAVYQERLVRKWKNTTEREDLYWIE